MAEKIKPQAAQQKGVRQLAAAGKVKQDGGRQG
jgi:hypothetical protein